MSLDTTKSPPMRCTHKYARSEWFEYENCSIDAVYGSQYCKKHFDERGLTISPAIVCPGDQVRGQGWIDRDCELVCGHLNGKVMISDSVAGTPQLYPPSALFTLDGRPVTGFAWARVEQDTDSGRVWPYEVKVNGVTVAWSVRLMDQEETTSKLNKALEARDG